jgi:CBS domain-containing protein
MVNHRVSHVVVIDPASQQPIGILSTLDVVRALADRSR